VGEKKKKAHNPKDVFTPENLAARTTKSVPTTWENDTEECFAQQPDAPHESA